MTCTKCGFQNVGGAPFCSRCGAFLEWQRPESSEPSSRPPATKEVVRPEVGRAGVAAVLRPANLTIEPGQEALCQVLLRNTGTIVDQVMVQVLGDTAHWALVEPSVVPLFPGGEGTARITLKPPRHWTTPAGTVAIRIRASSQQDPGIVTLSEATVQVATFSEVSIDELVPPTSEGRRWGNHRVTVTNEGNLPAKVAVSAADVNNVLDFDIQPPSFAVEPGGSAVANVKVIPRRRFLTGPPRMHPFRVKVQPAGKSPTPRDGAMRQLARFPAGVLPALIALFLLAAIATPAWIVLAKPFGPATSGSPATSASASPTVPPCPAGTSLGPHSTVAMIKLNRAGAFEMWRFWPSAGGSPVQVTVSPGCGTRAAPGSPPQYSITVAGSNFTPGGNAQVRFDAFGSPEDFSTTVNSAGQFTLVIAPTRRPPGNYTIQITDLQTTVHASVKFLVP